MREPLKLTITARSERHAEEAASVLAVDFFGRDAEVDLELIGASTEAVAPATGDRLYTHGTVYIFKYEATKNEPF